MAEAAHHLERILAVVGAASAPDAPWWQELAEKVQDELLGEVAALIVAAILALLAFAQRRTIGGWWAKWGEKRRHLRAQIKAERQRELLVASMRRVWVDGYLRSALDLDGSALDLDTIRYLPVRLRVEPDGRPAHRQPDQVDNLVGVWDRSGRRKLRLTGDWGTGKTVHLVMLACCLLDRADRDLDQASSAQQSTKPVPVPVVLNVSNWDAKEGTFDRWLLNEVARRHSKDVDADALRQLLADYELTLLLDGVDEHADPAGCAKAINAMLDNHTGQSVIVAYRSDPIDPVRQQVIEQHLGWLDEVQVQPLDHDTVDRLLADAGRDWTGVRQLIAANADLWEPLIRRPLVLAVIMRTFRSKAPEDIPALHGSLEDWQAQLYEGYMDAAVRQAPRLSSGQPAPAWEAEVVNDPAPVHDALAWLANTAEYYGLGTTVYLEQIGPAWLPDQLNQDRARRQRSFGGGLVGGLIVGVVVGLTLGPVARLGGLARVLFTWLVLGLTLSPASGVFGPVGGRARGVPGRLVAGLVGVLVGGLVGGRPGMLVAGLVSVLTGGLEARLDEAGPALLAVPTEWTLTRVRQQRLYGVFVGLVFAFVGGLVFGLPGGLVVGVVVGLLISGGEMRAAALGEVPFPVPVRRSIRRTLPVALVGGVFGGLAVGLAAGVTFGLIAALAFVLLPGLLLVVHPEVSYRVVHRALRRSGLFPGRSLIDFLDWCVAHRLLLPVGYGYRFLHPTFQEHLAKEWRRERSAEAGSGSHESGVSARR